MKKVAITTSSFAQNSREPLDLLKKAGLEVILKTMGRKLTREESLGLLSDLDYLIAGVETLDRDILKVAIKLKAISRVGVGVDNIDLQAAKDLGIKVLTTLQAPTQSVAELTLALILDSLRKVSSAHRQLTAGEWRRPQGFLLAGKIVGLIGLGRIGQRVAKLLAPFKVNLLACDPFVSSDKMTDLGIKSCPLEELLQHADIVSLHVPLNDATRLLVNAPRLAMMKKNAILINSARGGLLDEAALAQALREKKLAHAALDTFVSEPYKGELTTLANVTLTPHIGSAASETRMQMELEAVQNLLEVL